jgi:ribonuclease P protein component
VIHVTNDATASPARAGFIVGKAVGPAVRRNRLRRRLQHLIAPRLDRLPAGTMVVVRATPGAAAQSGRELAATFGSAFDRAVAAVAA